MKDTDSSDLNSPPSWFPSPPRLGWTDVLALGIWTLAIVIFFGDLLSFRRALFYFDITEINMPYRDFLARELKAGRFSRWIPGLYCGHPLYSESQAGYLHPLKYLFYPWMETWKAFSLDVVCSIWLTGLGGYVWLRRHVCAWAALAGASIVALSGFTWSHFVHTSMINALASVPWMIWSLEDLWITGRRRGYLVGSVALACQVFAGHLQDAILTGGMLFAYSVAYALTEPGWKTRLTILKPVIGMGVLGVLLAAVQWIPSKDLIDRSPRSDGLTWDDMTYGSWHPELLPTLLVREAYGTRARDTDWMDGFYPYHEMNIYVGLVGLLLALLGASAYRQRWVACWIMVALVGGLLMLGRFTFLMDLFPKIPMVGSGRIPVRYHLWLAMAAAALAATGADRVARAGLDLPRVRLRPALLTLAMLGLICLPILAYAYLPAWTERARWATRFHTLRYQWLGWEWAEAAGRSAILFSLALLAIHASKPNQAASKRRFALAGLAPLLLADLLLSHRHEVVTVDPNYWTQPPKSARWLNEQPDVVRIYGEPARSSGEPGYASETINFMPIRESLAWSLAPVWNLNSTAGETPIISRRRLAFTEAVAAPWRFAVEGLSHVVTSLPDSDQRLGPGVRVGPVSIHHNPSALPRLRLMGRPLVAANEEEARRLLSEHGPDLPQQMVLESLEPVEPVPDRVEGSTHFLVDLPERIEADVKCATPSFLLLADTFDPGWSAWVDGQPAKIRPAYLAFRAVHVPAGHHTVRFRYEPKGFRAGLLISGTTALVLLIGLVLPRSGKKLHPLTGVVPWSSRWPLWAGLLAILIVGISVPSWGSREGFCIQRRWERSIHRFTWGSGIEAMGQPARPSPGR